MRVCVSSLKTVSVCCSRKSKITIHTATFWSWGKQSPSRCQGQGSDSGGTISHCGQSLFYCGQSLVYCGQSLFYCDTGFLAGQCSSHRPTVTSTSCCDQPSAQNLTVLRAERWPENEATCICTYIANPCHPHKHYNILRQWLNIRV